MPIYIYKCPICGKEKDIIHKMSENPLIICDDCQEVEIKGYKDKYVMKRILQPTAFKIKGYFTSKTGYSKNKKYEDAVVKKEKSKRKKDG